MIITCQEPIDREDRLRPVAPGNREALLGAILVLVPQYHRGGASFFPEVFLGL